MARKWSEMRADELAELRAATFLLERILEDAQIGRAAAERALADERAKSAELTAKVAQVEALIDQWDGEVGAQEDYQVAAAVRAVEACMYDLRTALAGSQPEGD